ncbi:class I SAM-dependent DNA methyltransferase [Microvirga lotononidis]|uniref:Putative methyltransferase (Contains TPR repeat) n=1 Tax=Microvirga lotononidis TaxID=864069 RepID=I4YXP1_9HYPH|nr:methyltransferase domain-containing protein [Microvirga lotononidis]EIM28733.1 putative methyltransferase (contains TPR repeat) [Microvirga lotononidis]WQO25530.1 methyltransferase domain-containing protein [Microvirga lotononidis]
MSSTSSVRSSGDFLADRRYEYARGAFDERDFAAAADLARQVLELAPDFAAAHAMLGRSLAELGAREEAVEALHRALALEPEDALGVRLDLARLGAVAPDEAITDGYVRALFDDYAPKFDRHLTGSLAYRGPALIAEALRRTRSRQIRDFRFGLTFDLGCGTGLMAQEIAGLCAGIVGVDLSPRMLEKAERTKLYDALHEGELVAFLSGRETYEADLVVAADVFVYMAALDGVFRQAHRVLKPEGLFAFTVQAHEGDGYILGDDARYAHSEPYLRRLADSLGFTPIVFERASTREDRGVPVPGFLVVLQR